MRSSEPKPEAVSDDLSGFSEPKSTLESSYVAENPPMGAKPSDADEDRVGSSDDSNSSPRDVHGIAWVLVVVAIISSMFLFGLDQTITADVQPAIIKRFDSTEKLPWISVALLLGASASNLFWGQVYANYNAKWIYLICFLIFEVGSTLCGASPAVDVLIGGRALCGFGGTGMYNGVVKLPKSSTPFIFVESALKGSGIGV